MKTKIYSIGGKQFEFRQSLAQDECLGPVLHDMFTEIPDVVSSSPKHLEAISNTEQSAEVRKENSFEFSLNMLKINAWLYSKKYVTLVMATCLVEKGKEFNEDAIPELKNFFGIHTPRETATEVINNFFMKSAVFGIGIPQSL